jgi:hypothetical protein
MFDPLPIKAMPRTSLADPQRQKTQIQVDILSYSKGKRSWQERTRYDFNAHGYRCDEFRCGPPSVLVIGCSYTFGQSLYAEATYPWQLRELFQARFGRDFDLWNLGMPGRGNDYISRVLMCALPALKPSFVFVYFTHAGRREILSPAGEEFPYLPTFPDNDKTPRLIRAMHDLHNDTANRQNMLKNFHLCRLLLDSAGVPWSYGVGSKAEFELGRDFFDTPLNMGDYLIREPHDGPPDLQWALDDRHPGPAPSRRFAGQIFDHAERLGLLDRVTRRLAENGR